MGVGVEQLKACVVLAICVAQTRSADPSSDFGGRSWSWVAVTNDTSMNSQVRSPNVEPRNSEYYPSTFGRQSHLFYGSRFGVYFHQPTCLLPRGKRTDLRVECGHFWLPFLIHRQMTSTEECRLMCVLYSLFPVIFPCLGYPRGLVIL